MAKRSEPKWPGMPPRPRVKQKRKNPEEPTKSERRTAFKHARNQRLAAKKAVRPVCKLDEVAMALGVYDEDFHKKPRYERSAIVHKAKQEAA